MPIAAIIGVFWESHTNVYSVVAYIRASIPTTLYCLLEPCGKDRDAVWGGVGVSWGGAWGGKGGNMGEGGVGEFVAAMLYLQLPFVAAASGYVQYTRYGSFHTIWGLWKAPYTPTLVLSAAKIANTSADGLTTLVCSHKGGCLGCTEIYKSCSLDSLKGVLWVIKGDSRSIEYILHNMMVLLGLGILP